MTDADKRAAAAFSKKYWTGRDTAELIGEVRNAMAEAFIAGRQSLAAKVEALEKVGTAAEDYMKTGCQGAADELEEALAALKSLETKGIENGTNHE